MSEQFGFVAIIGRPNVGKSTLLNRILGKKISITSKKPQTTRNRILGIKTVENTQVAYVDTPGLHANEKFAAHRHLNRAARAILQEVDLIMFLVDVKGWEDEDDWILEQLKSVGAPVILVVNKIDRLNNPKALLPFMEDAAKRFDFKTIVPISAKKGDQVFVLEEEIIANLPEGLHGYPPDQWTDRNDRFMAAEILREKLFRMLGEELPYAIHVTIDAFEEDTNLIKIAAIIWVQKDSQKAIVIGKGGSHLKDIATKARLDMERYFEKKVFLKPWVKVGTPKQQEED
ncbi:MAG: GTPase Era [Coxiellaceae bacterium]|nr:GTPase Era [Coxiellaceae bacterium]